MNLNEWNLEYETEMQRHILAVRKLTRLLPGIVRRAQPDTPPDQEVASTNTPDVEGQERLDLKPPLDLIV